MNAPDPADYEQARDHLEQSCQQVVEEGLAPRLVASGAAETQWRAEQRACQKQITKDVFQPLNYDI